MVDIPGDVLFTQEHYWLRVEGREAIIGLTDAAQDNIGDIMHITLPSVGDEFHAGDEFGDIESRKNPMEIYMPISGQVVEVNDALEDTPQDINEDPFGSGWIIRLKITDPAELDELLTPDDYDQFMVEGE